MKEFFKVVDLDAALAHRDRFKPLGIEKVPLMESLDRILAIDIISKNDLPDFTRATMDGYAVKAASTFGASEGNPAYFTLKGQVLMGEAPDFTIQPDEAARIATGGMLPEGSDSVLMIEHTEIIDTSTIEAYRSVAPGQHTIACGEDYAKGDTILSRGTMIRAQEIGLLAAYGYDTISVFKKPVIAIISTGDEVVPIDQNPDQGCIRDINSYTIAAHTLKAGGIPVRFGIAQDQYEQLDEKCRMAIASSDMVLISGGSSVGQRDFTLDVLKALPDSELLVHGISISPGKPTILFKIQNKAVWGLPGHVVSSMVVFKIVVRPFIEALSGLNHDSIPPFKTARLSRNIPSAQGRVDFVRVRLTEKDGTCVAEPILGKSGLLNTMVKAHGLIKIDLHSEGLNKNTRVNVFPLD